MKDDVLDDLLARLDALCPAGNSFGFHIRDSRPLLTRATYREDWLRNYTAKTYILCDPAVVWGLLHPGTRRWSEIDLPDPSGLFADAAHHGLRYGTVVSCGPRGSRTVGNCARQDREFTDSELQALQQAVIAVHDHLGAGLTLKPIQAAALQALADGLTYDEACDRLGISRTALRNRLSGARLILRARDNADAVRLAIVTGQISTSSLDDLDHGVPRD